MDNATLIDTPEMRFALQFAKKAGILMRSRFSLDVTADWKDNETPLTVTDTEINNDFITAVTEAFPGYSILGEEASKPLEGAEWAWVIDPIDGTGPFVQGMPLFTCCLALLRDGTPELGVIYDPMLDRVFYAQKGRGAYMNGDKIHVSDADTLNRTFVHMDSMRTGDRRLLPLRQDLLEQGCVPLLINAIQYGSALTCAGRGAGVVFSLPSFWDAAPSYTIAIEAGAVMTDLYGNQQRYDQPTKGFIMANPAIHKQLLQMVAKYLK
jgi:fructose-1,6-bisphosphatase/inositol monophosphatase family enzyme